MRNDYRRWLESQEYGANTISTQCSHVARLEQVYGDLDEQYDADRLEKIAMTLRYSSGDARRGAPNPSKIHVNGDIYKSLASFRSAIGLYRRFREEIGGSPAQPISETVIAPRLVETESRERIGLERDLQKALRREIGQLEAGLVVIDEGVERAVPSGYIDITARDATGAVVVIELKAGVADRTAIGQILSYMGDITAEEDGPVRGILIAHDFDTKAKAASRMVANLSLRSYAVKFAFGDPIVTS